MYHTKECNYLPLTCRYVDKYQALGVHCMMHVYAEHKTCTSAHVAAAICKAVQ